MTSRSRRLHVTASEVTRSVEIGPDGQISVEGVADPVEVTRVDQTTFRAVVAGRSVFVTLVATRDGRFAFADGCNFTVDVDTPTGPRRTTRGHPPDLSAPMPATVVTVLVDPGQAVQRGDALVVLEAMKMELSLRAPRDGVIDTVTCREGDLVQPGAPLVTMTPAPPSGDGRV